MYFKGIREVTPVHTTTAYDDVDVKLDTFTSPLGGEAGLGKSVVRFTPRRLWTTEKSVAPARNGTVIFHYACRDKCISVCGEISNTDGPTGRTFV